MSTRNPKTYSVRCALLPGNTAGTCGHADCRRPSEWSLTYDARAVAAHACGLHRLNVAAELVRHSAVRRTQRRFSVEVYTSHYIEERETISAGTFSNGEA